ncbi:PD-(D/E)XK nuclease family transposase [Pedobacter sp. MC2016-24]|uniref:PD-(D/E)XK nuclease family transposase n=1 Tax=Pedobacter sp. MC2016-24 TaxID=2780090 RepID=UPI00351C98B7
MVICLANSHTGKIIYDKLSLIFIEMINFFKGLEQLETDIDRWLYALKHLTEFRTRPAYLSGPEFDQLFNLAQYANLTKKEKAMYDASLKYKWDNKNVRDYEVSKGREEGREQGRAEGREEERSKALEDKREIALELKKTGLDLDFIAKTTKLSLEEIQGLN